MPQSDQWNVVSVGQPPAATQPPAGATPAPAPAAPAAPAAAGNPWQVMSVGKPPAAQPEAPVQHYTDPTATATMESGGGGLPSWTPSSIAKLVPKSVSTSLARIEDMFRYANPNSRPRIQAKDREDNSMQLIRPEEAMSETEQKNHPMATAVAQFAGGMTSPENVGLIMATEGGSAAAPLLEGALEKIGLKTLSAAGRVIAPRLLAGGFSIQMLKAAYDRIPEIRDAWNKGDESEVKRLFTHAILDSAMAALTTQHAVKGTDIHAEGETQYEKAQRELRQTEVAVGGQPPVEPSAEGTPEAQPTPEANTIRPTTKTIAGVPIPVTAGQSQEEGPGFITRAAQKLATPGQAEKFQDSQTKPAATDAVVSTMSRSAEQKIAQHEALVNGDPAPESLPQGTPGKYDNPDHIWAAMQNATNTTWEKAREASKQEVAEWEQEKQRAVDNHKAGIDHYNQLASDHNSTLEEGGQPIESLTFNPEEVPNLPERPVTFDELRDAVKQAKDRTMADSAEVATKARQVELPKAEKALDKWFTDHDDVITPEEYDSAKKLYAESFNYQDMASYLRTKIARGSLTGADLRGLEAKVNSVAIRQRGQAGIGTFRKLVGPETYQNIQDIAKLFDPIERTKDPASMFRSWGAYVMEYAVGGLMGSLVHAVPGLIGGIAVKAATEAFLNKLLYDPEFGSTFGKVVEATKTAMRTGRQIPNDLMANLIKGSKDIVDKLRSSESGAAGAAVDQRRSGSPVPAKFGRVGLGGKVSGNFREVEHGEYADAVRSNPQAATLSSPEDMEKNRKFSNGEGVYYSISPEGDLQGVVNNSDKSGALAKLMPHAIEQGAKTLDAWDLFLPKQYEKYGFERTERVPYDVEKYGEPSEELKSAWRKQGWKDSDEYPAVQHMRLRPSLELHHWSNVPGLTETNPETMGTGKAGREMARSKEPGFLKRTNFGTEGYKEPAIQGQKFHYVAKANPAEYYDAKSDPQGIWQKAFQEGGATAAENAVKDAGYKGYRVGNEVASFEKVPVKPVDADAERLKQIAQPKRDTDLMGQARKKLGPDAPLSAVAQEAARMAQAARTASAVQSSAAAAPAVEPMKPELEIGTRYPKSKDATGENNPDHMPNMDAMEQAEKHTPGYFDKLIDALRGYDGANGLDLEDRGRGSKGVLDGVINHLADNLQWLHDNTPGYVRGISKQWYDTANKMTKDMAGRYGIAHEKMAAVVAALSPKNGWDNNVGMADRLVNIWKNSRDHEWDTEMENKLNKITGNPKLKAKYRDMLNSIRGQKYGDLTAKSEAALLAKKGLWIRIFDEAHNGKQTPVYAPDGTIRAHQTLAWGMPDPMAKAIAVLEGPEGVDHINDIMGDKNKIRSFYNNIINPNSFRGHVTVDTHAVNATMLKPLGSDDDEVWHNFSGAPGHADTGLAGTYAVHAEAYRRAAAKLGLKPRELQSITWEAIRTLFGEEKKTPELKAKVNEIWQRYAGRAADPGVKAPGGDFESRPTAGIKKSLTLDQVRDEIVKAAGGFSRPVWGEQDWKSKVKGTGDAGPRVGEGKYRDSATEFNPESFSANPNEAVGDNLQQPMHQTRTTDTKAFKRWFGDSKVTDEQGEPKVVYHGTTHEFNEFTPERGNVENHFGKGYYFTDEPGDANRNYVGEAESGTTGPDLTNRIDQRVEELRNEIPEEPKYGTPEYHEMMERLTEEAKAELQGQSPHIKPTYIKMENPVIVQPDGGTRFELEVDDDGNESGSALKLYDAVREVADEWDGDSTPVDGQRVWGDIMSKLPDSGYDFNAHEFAEAASTALTDHEISVDGKYASGEFIRRVFEKAGFDGIEQDAHADFRHMGVSPGTRHYIVFDPRNIKSATGNAGTFDPKSPNIQQQSVTLGQGPTTMNVDATPAVSPELVEKWQGKPQPTLKRTPSGRPDWSGKYGPGLQDVADHLNANVTPEHMTFASAHEMAHAFIQHHVGTGTDGMEIVLGNKAMRRGRKVGSGNAKSTSDGVAGGFVAPGDSWLKRQQSLGGEPEKIQSFLKDYTMQLMAGKAMEELLGQPGTVAAMHAKNDIAMSRKMLGLFNVPAYLHDMLIHNATKAAKEVLQQNFDTLHHLTRQAVKHYGKHPIDAETFHHYREGGEFKEPDEK